MAWTKLTYLSFCGDLDDYCLASNDCQPDYGVCDGYLSMSPAASSVVATSSPAPEPSASPSDSPMPSFSLVPASSDAPAPSPSSMAGPSCPDDDQTDYIVPSDPTKVYRIYCYTDFYSHDLPGAGFEATFADCMESCDTVDTCIGVSFVPSQQQCYYKNDIVTDPHHDDGVWGACLLNENGDCGLQASASASADVASSTIDVATSSVEVASSSVVVVSSGIEAASSSVAVASSSFDVASSVVASSVAPSGSLTSSPDGNCGSASGYTW
jgi:hypothetical protein